MEEFLKGTGLILSLADLREQAAAFGQEMARGLGQKDDGSLAMIPTYIQGARLPDGRRSAVVVDAGGTNLRLALVEFTGEGPKIRAYEKHPMLGTQGAMDAADFFARLAALIAPFAGQADQIGICFSFPAEILPDRDARILYFDKEVQVDGAQGLLIGAQLRAALDAQGYPSRKSVVVINDTVAALLGAIVQPSPGMEWGGYVGFILGTGVNCCYVEDNARIVKSGVLRDKPGGTVINIESGGYDRMPQSAVDRAFIARTADPGGQKMEKMVSGAYQSALLLEYIRAAADVGCFSGAFRQGLNGIARLSGKEVDAFCLAPYGENILASLCGGKEDTAALYHLADAFFDRASLLIAASLTAVLRTLGDAAADPSRPVCIAAEGTTFYKAPLLRPKLDYYMAAYAQRELGLYSRFVRGEDATILGTAVAALQGNEGPET